jgi:putative mRNA 3-end processing factor
VKYGQTIKRNGVNVTLYPAGHLLGSAQVRVEHQGEVWVASGDYKIQRDVTCEAFEPVKCHCFITESTFGLPIYRWQEQAKIFDQINAWWLSNKEAGKASLVTTYALGKAQRVIAGLDATIGPIYTHGAVEELNKAYREAGVTLPETTYATAQKGKSWAGSMIIAPPSALGSPWIRKFGAISIAAASGWMTIRGTRRRKSLDRGFILSDHADWPGLISAIEATGASRVLVTHGYTAVLARYLETQGKQADILQTRYTGESPGANESAEEITNDPYEETPEVADEVRTNDAVGSG